MASFNKLILVGYLGRDPEQRYLPNGDAVCNFSVATTERRKDQAGEYQDQTTWFRVTAFQRLAENCAQYLSKGKQVYVEGRLRQTEYTDNQGTPRTQLEVTASDVRFLGSAGDAPRQQETASGGDERAAKRAAVEAQAPAKSKAKPAPKQQPLPGGNDADGYIEEDDIPF